MLDLSRYIEQVEYHNHPFYLCTSYYSTSIQLQKLSPNPNQNPIYIARAICYAPKKKKVEGEALMHNYTNKLYTHVSS